MFFSLQRLFFLGPCVLAIEPSSRIDALQVTCMKMTIGPCKSHHHTKELIRMGLVKKGNMCDDVCQWEGCACKKGILTSIRWEHKDNKDKKIQVFTLMWLPPSLETVVMCRKSIGPTFQTRRLPRALQHMRIEYCNLSGELQMRGLPRRIETLVLPHNSFSGTVNLVHLPATVRRIDLSYNPLKLGRVENSHLPKGLEEILIGSIYEETKIVGLDGPPDSRRIRVP